MLKQTLLLATALLVNSSVLAVDIGDPMPGCKVNHFNQTQTVNLSDYQGKVVYLDFWASWCGPCKQSFPAMNRLQKELQKQGLQIIAVNLDEEQSDAETFLKQQPVNFLVAQDQTGTCPKAFQVMAMPSSYIIDSRGMIRDIHLGFNEGDEQVIRDKIIALLQE